MPGNVNWAKSAHSESREETAMDRIEFAAAIAADPNLKEPIERAGKTARPPQFGMVAEAAVVALMFPVVRYMVVQIGLPWLYELKRYSELQRQKVHRWIDERARAEGIDPDAAEAASEALCKELEQTTGASARASWEHLAELMKSGADDKEE
jgi:hypothetical protein